MTRRYLALGDSYTIGEGVDCERALAGAARRVALRDAGVSIRRSDIVAKTGWTTGDLLAATRCLSPPRPRTTISSRCSSGSTINTADSAATCFATAS